MDSAFGASGHVYNMPCGGRPLRNENETTAGKEKLVLYISATYSETSKRMFSRNCFRVVDMVFFQHGPIYKHRILLHKSKAISA